MEGPYYNVPSSALGGGAVGLAPFRVYAADSEILDGGYYFRPDDPDGNHAPLLPNPFRIRHYGPIAFGAEGAKPKVDMRDPYGSAWANVSHLFQIVRENSPSSTFPRTVKITYVGTNGIPMSPGYYRVRVEEGDLVCLGVGVGEVSVVPYEYYFTVALDCYDDEPTSADFLSGTWNPAIDCDRNGVYDGCDLAFDAASRDRNSNGTLDTCELVACPCDFNGDYLVNSQDFFDYLNCYFNISCPQGRTADFNQDGYVNSQDFFDFLNCFFGGC